MTVIWESCERGEREPGSLLSLKPTVGAVRCEERERERERDVSPLTPRREG